MLLAHLQFELDSHSAFLLDEQPQAEVVELPPELPDVPADVEDDELEDELLFLQPKITKLKSRIIPVANTATDIIFFILIFFNLFVCRFTFCYRFLFFRLRIFFYYRLYFFFETFW